MIENPPATKQVLAESGCVEDDSPLIYIPSPLTGTRIFRHRGTQSYSIYSMIPDGPASTGRDSEMNGGTACSSKLSLKAQCCPTPRHRLFAIGTRVGCTAAMAAIAKRLTFSGLSGSKQHSWSGSGRYSVRSSLHGEACAITACECCFILISQPSHRGGSQADPPGTIALAQGLDLNAHTLVFKRHSRSGRFQLSNVRLKLEVILL